MKIHLIIEIEPDGVKIRRAHEVAPVPAGAEVILANGEKVVVPGKRRGRPPKGVVPVAEPAAPVAELADEPVRKPGSGPQFAPGFLKAILDAPEPFTRRSIAMTTGKDEVSVTQSFNRLLKKGLLENPARGCWRRTKLFYESWDK